MNAIGLPAPTPITGVECDAAAHDLIAAGTRQGFLEVSVVP
jgi:hypothetical protein